MSSPYEQQPFAQPGPLQDPRLPPPQPGQLTPSPPQFQYLPPQPQWLPPAPVSKQKNGLAITALVVSCLALVLVLGLIAFVVVTGFFSPPGELQGTAPQVVAGVPYKGALLADELSRVITADFGDVGSMTCPQTPVNAHVVVSCHGVVDGYDSTVEVTFEDGLGHFTLVED
jgi:hypothetical protein